MGEVIVLHSGERIWHLRCAGMDFAEISKELNLSTAECVSRFREFQTDLIKTVSLDKREHRAHLAIAPIDAGVALLVGPVLVEPPRLRGLAYAVT